MDDVFVPETQHCHIRFGHHVDQYRAHEDRFVNANFDNFQVFIVFDGHSLGDSKQNSKNPCHVVNYASKFFTDFLETNMKQLSETNYSKQDIYNIIIESFIAFDIEMKTKNCIFGSTCCLVLIDKRQRCIYNANIGDSRFVLARNFKVLFGSEDHVPMNNQESKRIEEAEVNIVTKRMYIPRSGYINLSRSFGDYNFKIFRNQFDPIAGAMSSMPTITHFEYDEPMQILLASDGAFYGLSNQLVLNYYFKNAKMTDVTSLDNIAENITLQIRQDTLTTDDITVALIEVS